MNAFYFLQKSVLQILMHVHVPNSTASAPMLCIHLKPLDCRILVLGQELPAVKASERSSQYLAGYQQIESNNKKVRFPGKWRVGG